MTVQSPGDEGAPAAGPVRSALGPLRRVEVVVVGLCVALGLALLVASLAGYRSALSALPAVSRGQADALVNAAARTQWPTGLWSESALDQVVEEEKDGGLRCIAAFDERLRTVTVVGQCLVSGEEALRQEIRSMKPTEVREAGERLRAIGQVPPGWPGRPPGPDPGHRPPRHVPGVRGDRRGPPPAPPGSRGRPAPLFVEFEPLLTRNLAQTAERNLLVGAAASFTLAVAALVLWRLSVRASRVQAAIQAEQRLAALGEMSAVLAHEIRNPLASMKGHAQLLVEQIPESERGHAKASRLVTEIRRLERLTSDLLSFVRARGIERSPVDPREPLRAAAEELGDAVDLQLDGAPSRWSLDAEAMRRALANLLQNAAQASPDGSVPTAAVRAEGSRLVYAVGDRGPGVPPHERARIFEPFHTTKTRGTGLGLAVTRRIVESHGGRIWVEDGPEGGALFRLELPRA